jgi:hypothetical protein
MTAPIKNNTTTAQVIPFPAVRCRRIVDDAFIAVTELSELAGLRHLERVVRKRRAHLEASGVARHLIEADIAELTRALGVDAGDGPSRKVA